MTDWGWIVVSVASGLVGGILGILLTWASLSDCHKEQWQLRDDLYKTRVRLDGVMDKLDAVAESLPSKTIPKGIDEIPDRSEGRPGPRHRTMWGDV